MMRAFTIPFIAVNICFFALTLTTCQAESCDSEGEIQICAQFKGSCGLDDIISGQAKEPEMDMIFVSIRNRSYHTVRINPNLFYGISEKGTKVALDKSLYESIEWKRKLGPTQLDSNSKVEGFLFFPSTEGHIKILEYGGNPHLKVSLY